MVTTVYPGDNVRKHMDDPEVVSKMNAGVEDYENIMHQIYTPMFHPFRDSLNHYVRYLKPVIRKSLNSTPLRDLELASLGLRKCCESIMVLGENFSLNSEELNDPFRSRRFDDRISYLNFHYPLWIPNKIIKRNLSISDMDYYFDVKDRKDPEFEKKIIDQLKESEAKSVKLFSKDFLIESYKTSSKFIHFNKDNLFGKEIDRDNLKKCATQMKEVHDRIGKSCVFTVENGSQDKDTIGLIISVGDKNKYYYSPVMQVRDTLSHLK